MPLTVFRIDATRPSPKAQKLSDGNGLYLFVPPSEPENAGKQKRMAWRFDYRFGGKRYTLSLGLYPSVGLAEARARLISARQLLDAGKNPAQAKREEKLLRVAVNSNSFASVAEAWYESKFDRRSVAWRDTNALYLKRDLNPKIGSIPITQISQPLLAEVLETAKSLRGVKTADRIRQTAVQVFDYAIRKSKAEINPARLLKRWEDIPEAVSHAHLSASEIPEFLERVDSYNGQLATKFCLKLLMLTFVRKTELTEAEWSEIDLDQCVWSIPADRMKMKSPHIVPLSVQSIEVLTQLKSITGKGKFVFPNAGTDDKPMSRTTLNVAFRNMGYGDTFSPHGVRSTASTWLNEKGFRPDVIERQLAHTERNRIRAVYNKADYIAERSKMMQVWADYVDPRP